MLTSQRLQLELSELRNKINAMANSDDFEADALEKLNAEYRMSEIRFQSALIQENEEQERTPDGDLDSEGFEIRELRDSISTSTYVSAALLDEPLYGREKELNEALKLYGAGVQMPLSALLSGKDRAELRAEMRAATDAPSDADVITNRILGRVFSSGDLTYLGCHFPSVAPGAANYPVLSAGVAPATADKDGAANQTASVITPNVLKPQRLTAEYLVRIEDLYVLKDMEDALRMDLSGAITEAMDKEGISGDGSDPDITGILEALTAPTAPSAVATFADYASARNKQVDGRYAKEQSDVKLLVGADTFSHAAGIYQTGSGVSAVLAMGNPRVSPHIPDAASNIQHGIASRSMGRCVAPLWPAVSLIRDNVSLANKGQVKLISILLWSFKLLDTAGYAQLSFKLA